MITRRAVAGVVAGELTKLSWTDIGIAGATLSVTGVLTTLSVTGGAGGAGVLTTLSVTGSAGVLTTLSVTGGAGLPCADVSTCLEGIIPIVL